MELRSTSKTKFVFLLLFISPNSHNFHLKPFHQNPPLAEWNFVFDVGGKVDGVDGGGRRRKLHGMCFDVSGSRKRYQRSRQGNNSSIRKSCRKLLCVIQTGNTALMHGIENSSSTGVLLALGAAKDIRNDVRRSKIFSVICCCDATLAMIVVMIICCYLIQHGCTALMLACDKGKKDVAKLLLAAGADASCTNNVC